MVMRKKQLRWFGHIARMETENWVSKCKNLVIDHAAGRGIPCKTWTQIVQTDLQTLQLEKALPHNHNG